MEFKKFIESIKKELEARNNTYQFEIVDVLKNNGVHFRGIRVVYDKGNVMPCIYLEDYYRRYLSKNVSMESIVNWIECEVNRAVLNLNFDAEQFLKWDNIKDRISCRVINTEKNIQLLGDVPHREIMDLSVVYQVNVLAMDESEEQASFLIHNAHLTMWNVSEERLFSVALNNMDKKSTTVFINMKDMLARFDEDAAAMLTENEQPIYVLKNKCGVHGASEILQTQTLKNIALKLGGDYYILPSSVHETIILPYSMVRDVQEIVDMVCVANDTEVNEEDILSYHVYLYKEDEEKMCIIG